MSKKAYYGPRERYYTLGSFRDLIEHLIRHNSKLPENDTVSDELVNLLNWLNFVSDSGGVEPHNYLDDSKFLKAKKLWSETEPMGGDHHYTET